MIFIFGLVMTYNASQDIARTNDEILDRFAVIQAQSLELALDFEIQIAMMEEYTIGATTFDKQEFFVLSEEIDTELEDLLVLFEGIQEGIDLVQEIRTLFQTGNWPRRN